MATIIFSAGFLEAGVALTSAEMAGGDAATVSIRRVHRVTSAVTTVVAGAATTYDAIDKTWWYSLAGADTETYEYRALFTTTYATPDQKDVWARGLIDAGQYDSTLALIATLATGVEAAAILAAIGALNDLSDVDVWTYTAGAGRTLTSYPGLVGALSSLVCSTLLAESRIATTQLNLFIEAGTTRTITGSLYEADGGPVDLTGAELKWITSTDLEKTSAGGDITILAPPTGGAYTFTLSAAETQALVPQGDTADRIAHQLKVKLASGEIYAGFEGYIRIGDTMIDAW